MLTGWALSVWLCLVLSILVEFVSPDFAEGHFEELVQAAEVGQGGLEVAPALEQGLLQRAPPSLCLAQIAEE